MASAMDKQPAPARLSAVAAAGCLPTASRDLQCSLHSLRDVRKRIAARDQVVESEDVVRLDPRRPVVRPVEDFLSFGGASCAVQRRMRVLLDRGQ